MLYFNRKYINDVSAYAKEGLDELQLAIPYINEQKLLKKLGLSQNQDSSEST